MRPISATARQALTRSHRRSTRLAALDVNFEPIPGAILSGEQGYAISGSVTIDRRRAIRRTCNLTIANPDGVWTPDNDSDFFFFGNAIRIERGIYLTETEIEWCTLGVFIIDSPTIDVSVGSTLQVQGQDRLRRAAYAKVAEPLTYNTAARIQAVILDLATTAGMGATRYQLDDAGKTLAADRTYDSQQEIVAAMMDLARDYSLDLYVDAEGVVVLEPIREFTELPTSWTYEGGDAAVMLGLTKGISDQRLYNHVVVIGEAADQEPIRAEAMDMNPASPCYVMGPMGDRTYFYSSAMISTEPQAQAVADSLLAELCLLEDSIDLPLVVNPALEAGDAIVIIEPVTKTNARYLIDSIVIPLGAGQSTIQTKQIRPMM